MSFPKYEAYKESRVEWLGEVPEHWKLIRLRWLIQTSSGDFISNTEIESEPTDHKTTPVVGGNGVMAYTNETNTAKDTIIVGRVGAHCGNVHLLKVSSWVTDNALRIKLLSPNLCSEYIFHLFKALKFNDSANKNAQPLITGETIKSHSIALPPLAEEQNQIARFLDHETARIDALIAEQERLIELLKEKRQAVISHAVTKGLDPTAPMKDSGVEWLGEVPEHWEMQKLKNMFRLAKRLDSAIAPVLSVYRDYGVIEKSSRSDNHNKTPEDLTRYQSVSSGDLVINKMKSWQGSLGISKYQGITSPDYVVYEPTHSEVGSFLHYFLRSPRMPNVYKSISNGIRPDQWRLEPYHFEQLLVPLPPISEQQEIVEEIERRLGAYDHLSEDVIRNINLLQERRSALISAAVTGKIDVRDWKAPDSDAPAVL